VADVEQVAEFHDTGDDQQKEGEEDDEFQRHHPVLPF
jgi:hypothetical protein